jgi:hypothetical protein
MFACPSSGAATAHARTHPQKRFFTLRVCGCSESSSSDATGLSLYRFAKDESEEYIEKHQVVRDSLAKQLHHNSQGSGSMHRSSSARQESDTVAGGSIGEIDFRGVIMVRLIGCKDLAKGGNYARFTLGKQSLKSKSVGSSSNPVFNEVLMLSWDGRARLRGAVYSTSLFGKDEEIGNVDINLAERSSFENLPLQPSVTACFNRSVLYEPPPAPAVVTRLHFVGSCGMPNPALCNSKLLSMISGTDTHITGYCLF